MQTSTLAIPPRQASAATPRITVCRDDAGGWRVSLIVDGRVVESDFYTDWHRVERRRAAWQARLAASQRPATVVAAVIVMLALLPAGVFAQTTTEAAPGLLPEPRLLRSAIALVGGVKTDNGTAREGYYVETDQMVTGAGWISGGPGYRRRLFGDALLLDASAALSWRFYKVAQVRVEAPAQDDGRLTLGTQVLWRDMTQVAYFGSGPDSLESQRSDYRLQATNAVVYAVVRPKESLSLSGAAGWLSRPSLSSSTGPFDRDLPDATLAFVDERPVSAERQPSFFHGEVSVVHDTRDHHGHPTMGGVYRGAWIGYRDRHQGTHTFARYEAEGAHFLPFGGGRVVLALRGFGVFSPMRPSRIIPFYLLPSLGGNNTLRAYADYRFHDHHLLVANAEARLAVLTHVDAALFVDAGNVAPKLGELNLRRKSYGAGLRLHTGRSTIARLDVARGDEGWGVLLRLSDPLRLAGLSRRTAAVPFVP